MRGILVMKTLKSFILVSLFLSVSGVSFACGPWYYSAADNKTKSPERDITIYVNINPQNNHLELTGERVVGSTDNIEDTEVVNYLHDLLYEFTARRQKQNIDSYAEIKSKQNFDQFGGFVTMTFSTLIPIFNIQSIATADGTKILEPGQLKLDNNYINISLLDKEVLLKACETGMNFHS